MPSDKALDKTMVMDREWFAAHPGRKCYIRKATSDEMQFSQVVSGDWVKRALQRRFTRNAGQLGEWAIMTVVYQLISWGEGGGYRLRTPFSGTDGLADVDEKEAIYVFRKLNRDKTVTLTKPPWRMPVNEMVDKLERELKKIPVKT